MITKYCSCDRCGAVHQGSTYPKSWPSYSPANGALRQYYCSEHCARATMGGNSPLTRCGLTARQLQLLKLLALGNTNKEIGQSLGIAQTTVKNQLSIVFAALGVHDRWQALLAGQALSLINMPALASEFMARNKIVKLS